MNWTERKDSIKSLTKEEKDQSVRLARLQSNVILQPKGRVRTVTKIVNKMIKTGLV